MVSNYSSIRSRVALGLDSSLIQCWNSFWRIVLLSNQFNTNILAV